MFSKYFARLTDLSFKKDINGNTLFFPWGIYGKGRIIANELVERKIRSFIILYNQVCLLAPIFSCGVFGWIWSLLLTPILIGWFYWVMKSLLRGCTYSEEKLVFGEHLKKWAGMFNKFTLWLLLLSSSFFVMAGIAILFIAKSNSDQFAGISGIIFFGACTAFYGYMLRLKET